MRALLDVSVLVALLDRDHVANARARAWLREQIQHGWASCALTQNGAARILSQPHYPNPVSTAEALGLLADATATEHHEFWAPSVQISDDAVVDRARVHGPNQVTDLYLLALAVARGGRLATLDRGIALSAVRGASADNLVVL